MTFFAPRDAETSLHCPDCGTRLHIARSCREVHMYCPACRAHYPLREYIHRADEAMERFLENVYCDRIE
ncbi:dual CXXC motif small (seleno)protein [Desulfovibrio sp. ZJ200]|uniref:dual CXXC motif small (seleno)protein n=1 Tax=Desulfovibrio sp. ZJ200 TaxID=2709792 RepID=UPI0013EC42A2|nr:dual CXXC motif small (seleno)protein [Desulfovibrio sp. ZJ200]